MISVMDLIGLDNIKSFLSEIVRNKEVYAKYDVKPEHLIISLNEGDGHTSVIRYISKVYKQNNIILFENMDDYLEFEVTDSISQMQRIFRDIHAAAVYTNTFEGIIAFDISKLFESKDDKIVIAFI